MKKLLYILLFIGLSVNAQFSVSTGVLANQTTVGNPDLFWQTNAASTNEVNATTNWVVSNSSVISDAVEFYDGLYSIKIDNGISSFSSGFLDKMTLEIGSVYDIVFWAKVNVVSTQQAFLASGDWTVNTSVPITSTTWTQYTITGEAATTTGTPIFYVRRSGGIQSDILWIDLVTVIKQ